MLRHLESFDALPPAASSPAVCAILSALGWYNVLGVSVSTNTAFGVGKSLLVSGGRGNVLLGAQPSTVYFGVRCFIGADSSLTTTSLGLRLIDSVPNNDQVSVWLGINGVIRVFRGTNSGTLLGVSDAGAFPQGSWFWLEAGITIDNAAGSVEVRINGAPVLHLVSQDTQAAGDAYCDSWGFNCSGNDIEIDDLYVCDSTGSTNNTFLGNLKVQAQIPNGAGGSTQFTAVGAASNWQAAGNENIDDTAYVYSATNGQKDLYALQPVVNAPAIYGVQVRGAMRQDDAVQRTARTNIKNGATLTNGATKSLSQTYSATKDIYESNPATGVGFTGADVNAMQAGPEVVS